jgi:hypothetical protein
MGPLTLERLPAVPESVLQETVNRKEVIINELTHISSRRLIEADKEKILKIYFIIAELILRGKVT